MWLEEGREPTEHLLNELLSSWAQLARLPLRLVFLLRGRQALQNEKLQAALAALARAEVWFTADSAEPAARQRLCGAGPPAACSAVRRPAPYSPRLCRVLRRQRRYRIGLLSAGRARARIKKPLPPARGGSGFCLHIHL